MPASEPPRLLLITDRRCVPAGTLIARVARALDGADGSVAVLLRDKDLPLAERTALASALRTSTRAAGVRLLIHGDPALAREVGADGLHVADAPEARAHLADADPAWLLGASSHDARGLADAAARGAHYATLSPILPTPGKGPALGLDALAGPFPLPVLALGGVGPGTAGAAVAAGAWGVAGIRAFLAAEDPARAVRSTLEAMRDRLEP